MNLANLLMLIQLLPLLISTVKAVEEAVPMSGAGKAKTEAVLGILQVGQDMVPVVTTAISQVVNLLNGTIWAKPVAAATVVAAKG